MNSIVRRIKGSYTSRFITTVLIVVITFTGGIMTTTASNYFGTIKFASGQSNQKHLANSKIQSIPVQKAHVGDIDIAYKTFGKGEPFLLISGLRGTMGAWEPSILKNLSINHTVIIFDNRGVGNTTTGTKPFSIQQFANDTAGLLDALKIQKADVLGFSLGSFVAQQLAVTHPEKVNRLLLVAASCGGKESIPPSPQVVKFAYEMYKSTNNVPITPQDVRMLMFISMGSAWMKSHPNFLQAVPERKDLFGGIPLNTMKVYYGIVQAWESTNWSGVCDNLTRVSSPTLIISGTDDNSIPTANSLIIAAKIPGAWLVHIKDAGHAVMSQYPDKFNKVLQTFLLITTNPG